MDLVIENVRCFSGNHRIMCIVIDACVAAGILGEATDARFTDLRARLFGTKHTSVRIVHGGKLTR